MKFEYFQYSYNADNYGVLIHDPVTGQTANVDAGDAQATLDALNQKGWSLTELWITHHHWDHTDGLKALKKATGCHVAGPVVVDGSKPISGLDVHYTDGDVFKFAGCEIRVISTPGHTLDMINFYLPGEGVLFSGDTLFAMGCGRLFEGTPDQMFSSFEKLRALPPETIVYCSHEYTIANGKFALSVEPDNEDLVARMAGVKELRDAGLPTVPTTIQAELATNPFMRTTSAEIRSVLEMLEADDLAVFTKLRSLKDAF